MTPESKIPTSVLVALGLVGCTHSQACLTMVPCLDQVETGDPDTGDTTSQVCLSTVDTSDTADTGPDTGETGDTGGEPTQEVPAQLGSRPFERIAALDRLEGTLPDDVIARLQRK
jgi:hypothetical protein